MMTNGRSPRVMLYRKAVIEAAMTEAMVPHPPDATRPE